MAVKNTPRVFIISCPRSGTFLLMNLLQEEFGLAAPLETHFMPAFDRYKWLWGNLSKIKNRRRLIRGIFTFLRIWTPRMIIKGELKDVWDYTLLACEPYSEEIIANTKTYPEIVLALLETYSRIHNKNGWVEKSAFYASEPIERTAGLITGAKIIHLVRDGRDVALSWRKTWVGPETVALAAELWRKHCETAISWKERNPEDVLEIRYEDLLTDKEAISNSIGEFLGVSPLEEGSERSHTSGYAKILGKLDSHKLVSHPIATNNTDKFLIEMQNMEVEAFESIAGSMLAKHGYATKDRIRHHSSVPPLDYLRSWISINFFKRKVKSNLPLLIRFSQFFS